MFNDPLGDSYSLPGQSRETYAKDFPFGNSDVNSSFWEGDASGGSGWNVRNLFWKPLCKNSYSAHMDLTPLEPGIEPEVLVLDQWVTQD